MFLANENFPKPGILLLRSLGYEVKSIQENYPGITDPEVIKIAIESSLIVLTFDRDYGELIFRYAPQNPPAVIYFRDKGNAPLFAGQLLHTLLMNPDMTFENSFTVIEKHNIRQRFYKK